MPKGVYDHKLPPPSRKGSHLTDKQKRHLSKIAKERGFGKWMKGKKNSEETKRLKSVNHARYWLGKKRAPSSEESRKKMSKASKGHRVSQKTIDAVSKLNKGKFGKTHPKWTEQKKRPLYKAVRSLFKYREWRTAIFTRDNFTCVLCSKTGVYVEADHYPVRFVDILRKNKIETVDQALECKKLWDVGNGRTLCKPCHLKTITWGRKPRLQKD